MSTLSEAKTALGKGEGKGSYRVRSSGEKVHLAFNVMKTGYVAYNFAEGTSSILTTEDGEAQDWVIEGNEQTTEQPFIDPKAEQFVKNYYEALVVKHPKGMTDIGSIV